MLFLKKILLSLFFALIIFSGLNLAQAAGLDDAFGNNLKNAAETGAGYASASDKNNLTAIISQVILGLLSLLGIVFLILMVYAGFLWMTARGEEDKITDAKNTIRRAIVGLVIVAGSYAIAYFVFNQLLK